MTAPTFCQESEPPVTTGAVGAVRSMRTVSPLSATAGAQFDVNPAVSTARNWTRVSPSAVIVSVAPVETVLQVVPPSVDVRYW